MNRKKLPVGQDDFRKLIENGYYFVDKSWKSITHGLLRSRLRHIASKMLSLFPTGEIRVGMIL